MSCQNEQWQNINDVIINMAENMESRFEDISTSPTFESIPVILDVKTWPTKEEILNLFADESIIKLGDHFEKLLVANGCDIHLLLPEWFILKSHMIPIVKNNPDLKHRYGHTTL